MIFFVLPKDHSKGFIFEGLTKFLEVGGDGPRDNEEGDENRIWV